MPHRFGVANSVTAVRGALVLLIARTIPGPPAPSMPWFVVAAAVAATVLDGVDGWAARRFGESSKAGARFDMEVDALLIMVLSLLAWRWDKAGAWVILSGLLRYLFVAAGWIWPWMSQPLEPKRRRQTVCVIQIVVLIVVVSPIAAPPFSTIAAAVALAVLVWSFAVDVAWLYGRKQVNSDAAISIDSLLDMRSRQLHGIALVAALLLLDVSLTFHNVWPTPAISWRGEISAEFAAYVLVIAAYGFFTGRRISSVAVAWISWLWLFLVIGRYADVTATALFGRDINLYWDLRFIPDVVSLLAKAAHAWIAIGVFVAVSIVIALLYKLFRWALGVVAEAGADRLERNVLIIAAALVVVPGVPLARPVTLTYARQIAVAARAMAGHTTVPPSPAMTSNLARVKPADVYLIFLESYGAVTFDRPEFARGLSAPRLKFDEAIRATGRDAVSAFVESPTFGGNSWLAHISLMSGIEVRDPDVNAMLMAQKRETIVTNFAREGYRTIALMPGLWQAWPEGRFYGFDDIYGGERLAYQGPEFGWFDIPDEYALAKFDALEAAKTSRPPLFMFFPTISTHTPFKPTPPYQPDWKRILTDRPFDQADLDRSFDEQADWLNLGPSYVDAMTYTYTTLAGYLRANAGRDFVMILLGDHQPPALVSGEGAPWDVPVHVITSRRDVLDALVAKGFRRGLTPQRPDLSKMHDLLPALLGGFANPVVLGH